MAKAKGQAGKQVVAALVEDEVVDLEVVAWVT